MAAPESISSQPVKIFPIGGSDLRRGWIYSNLFKQRKAFSSDLYSNLHNIQRGALLWGFAGWRLSSGNQACARQLGWTKCLIKLWAGHLCLSLWVIWELCRLVCQGQWDSSLHPLGREVFLCHYDIFICTCILLCRLLNFYGFQYGPIGLTAGLTIISPAGEEQCGFCNSQVKSPLQELLGSQCFIGVWQKLPDNKPWDPASTQRFHPPKDMALIFLFLSPLVSCYVAVSAVIQTRELFWDPWDQCLHLSRATESFNSNRKTWQG